MYFLKKFYFLKKTKVWKLFYQIIKYLKFFSLNQFNKLILWLKKKLFLAVWFFIIVWEIFFMICKENWANTFIIIFFFFLIFSIYIYKYVIYFNLTIYSIM